MKGRFASSSLWLFVVLACLVICAQVLAQGPTPGQNINMVSGTQWPGGDPFLQRQNEPSMAVSTRNPLHILAGANDYRTVDVPYPDVSSDSDEQPVCLDTNGNPTKCAEPWVGVFKSFDGGQRWQSVLLPGYPQDNSLTGTSSPLHAFSTGSDPVVRAGTNGMFYYAALTFNRSNGAGLISVSRFMDLNNKENGDVTQGRDPIPYIDTIPVASGAAASFVDKEWLAVDMPRSGSGTCNLNVPQNGGFVHQSFAAGNVYLAFTKFNATSTASQLMFTRSTDCGATWSTPIAINGNFVLNQGATIQIDPETGIVYVAWRVFKTANQSDAIVGVASIDGGAHFTPPLALVTLPAYDSVNNPNGPSFFDQGTTGTSFRTNAYPAFAVDDSGFPFFPGRIYLAWSQRGVGPAGDARIMMMVLPSPSMITPSGIQLPVPFAVDNNALTDDTGVVLNGFGNQSRGHQFMPQITTAGGKVIVAYYDVRRDHTSGILTPNNPFMADPLGRFYVEQDTGIAEPGGQAEIFTSFVNDDPGLKNQRHSVEMRLAQTDPSFVPQFTYARVTSYKWGPIGDGTDTLHQLQLDPPNLPIFANGTEPFFGDYIDVVGRTFTSTQSRNGTTQWMFNSGGPSPTNYVSWTSNQDVRPPGPGQTWASYTPPALGPGTGGGTSTFDPNAQRPACSTGAEGTRNQNIYSSRVTQGLLISSPQNSKPLSTTLQRAFPIIVQNFTNFPKSFRLTIANQPPKGMASFVGVPNQPIPNKLPTPTTTLDVSIAAHSGVSRTVFALSSNASATITVNAAEITGPGGKLVAGGLTSFVILNEDGTTPPLVTPDGTIVNIGGTEVYNPDIGNPDIGNPDIGNPDIGNGAAQNPDIGNPDIGNPDIGNPDIGNPDIGNPDIGNGTVVNPDIGNPDIGNPDIGNMPVSDADYTVTNDGNTGAAYTVRLVGSSNTPLQLILSKIYKTPASANCTLVEQKHSILQTTADNPPIFPVSSNLGNPDLGNPDIRNSTVTLAPKDSAVITLRARVCTGKGDADDIACEAAHPGLPTMTQIVAGVSPVVVAQAKNTNTDTTSVAVPGGLLIITPSLPHSVAGQPYSATVTAIGGALPLQWTLVPGRNCDGTCPLNFSIANSPNDPQSAIITSNGTPPTFTEFFTVQVTDAQDNLASRNFSVAAPLNIRTTTIPTASFGVPYFGFLGATGGLRPYSWTPIANIGGLGLSLNPDGTITGTVSGSPTLIPVPNGTQNNRPILTVNFQAMVTDSGVGAQQQSASTTLQLVFFEDVVTFTSTILDGTTGVPLTSLPTGASSPQPFTVNDAEIHGLSFPGVSITLAIGSNPGGGVIGGTTTQTTDQSGNIAFSDITISQPGTGYTLTATPPGGPAATSNQFNVFSPIQ